jgi:anti-sigma B factor antagonist
MLSSAINVTIDYYLSTQTDGTVVLELCGDLDLASAPTVEAVLRQVTAEPPPLLVLDLRAVTFLDSAGVVLILRACRGQKAADQGLRIVLDPWQSAYRVLAISGLMKLPGIEWDTGRSKPKG